MTKNIKKLNYLSFLLDYLENHSGQTILWQDLADRFASTFLRKRPTKKRTLSKKKKILEDDVLSENCLPILKKLENLKLVQLSKDTITIAAPFRVEATILVTRSGAAFAQSDSGEEIFIEPKARKEARHRDRVLLRLLPEITKGKFSGWVEKIIKSFASEFLARLVAKADNLFLIELIDSPDEAYGLLPARQALKVESFLIVKTTETKLPVPLSFGQVAKKFSKLPLFQFKNILDAKSLQADMIRVALRFQLPLKYPKKVTPNKKEISQLERIGLQDKERRDLRHLYACTIDGEDAKDFDDAISFEQIGNIRRLYVHIADVSHYVRPHTPIDEEALHRGNSTYLTTLVIPMLPKILSEEYCSLKPNTDRLTFTCEMDFNEKGDMVQYQFYKSIIHLDKRYTYRQAEKELDLPQSKLYPIWQLASCLIEKRNKLGRIDLNIPELENIVDSHGRLTAIIHKERLRSHRLIEECMLSANNAVAHFAKLHAIPILHRVHEPISRDKLDKINAFLKLFGFSLELRSLSYSEIHRALKAVQGSKQEAIFHYLLLRSFTQAVYQREAKGHWALAFQDYTHFTSPIRRYSDLIVHRHLYQYLQKEKYSHSKEELDYFARETSRLERISMEAERTMVRLLAIRFLHNSIGQEFEGWLIGFCPNGLFVNINQPMVEGFVPASSFSNREEVISLDDFRLVLPKFSKTVTLGSKFRLRLYECNWEKIQLVFHILAILR